MKSTLALATILFSQASFAFPFYYECVNEDREILALTVKSKTKVVLEKNGVVDEVKADLAHLRANPNHSAVPLLGAAETLGHGAEGYNVYQNMSKSMLEGSKFGYLNSSAFGAEGALYNTLKCKRVK